MKKTLSIIVTICLAFLINNISPMKTANASLNNPATDWLMNGVYGIDVNVPQIVGMTWSQSVAAFDVTTLANQAEQAGASFVQLDIGQNSGYYAAPNATYNSYAGYSAGDRTSTRDLPLDMANALAPKGIKLFIYIPSNPPEADQQARNGFGWPGTGNDMPTQTSIKRWGEVLKEWGDRYGSKLAGWWFDGCRYPSAYTGTYDFTYFGNMAKSGYANRIFGLNSGAGLLNKTTDQQDFTAGESNDIKLLPDTRWFQGLQWQQYVYIGNLWNSATLAYSNQYLIDYINTLKYFGGSVTLNVAANSGVIPTNVLNQLIAIKNAVKDNVGTKHVFMNSSKFAGAVYTGIWTNDTYRDFGYWAPNYAYFNKYADINTDAMLTQTNNDSVEYTFNGTGVAYIGEKGSIFGNVDVYIDGVFKETINANATSTSYTQYLYSIEGLVQGSHTIKLVKKSGSYMLVDAFAVSNLGSVPSAQGIVDGATYKIYNKNSGKVLEVYGGSTSMGALIDQWPDENTNGKKWVVTDVGGGYYKIINVGSGYGLDISGTSNGTQFKQWVYQGNINQQFQIVSTGDGYFKIVARNSGLALDVYNASIVNGAAIVQWPYQGGDNQKWQFLKQ